MRRSVYAVYDVVAAAFLSLVLYPADAPAIRAFRDVLTAADSPLSKAPADYELYCLGEMIVEPQDVSKPVVFGDVPRLVVQGSVMVAVAPQLVKAGNLNG